MNHFLPPSVTPSGEEPIAADGRQELKQPKATNNIFTAACDAVG